MEDIINIIQTERLAKECDVSVCHSEIAMLYLKIEELQKDLDRLDAAEAALQDESLTVFKMVKPPKPMQIIQAAPTIKQMVLNVLERHPKGLVALDILSEINKTYNQSYARTSLSPQLTRLRVVDQIHKKGKRWILGPDPLSETEASGMD